MIQLSKSRRATYYIKDKGKLPKKYSDSSRYQFGEKDRLYDMETGKLVVKNIRSVGTPRYKKLNGQDIYNGNISRQARATLVKSVQEKFKPILDPIVLPDDPEEYPLTLELIFKMHDKGRRNIDNDNKWIWRKCIQDTLSVMGKWKDDNNYIISRNEEETILIPEDESQKLIINFYGRKK